MHLFLLEKILHEEPCSKRTKLSSAVPFCCYLWIKVFLAVPFHCYLRIKLSSVFSSTILLLRANQTVFSGTILLLLANQIVFSGTILLLLAASPLFQFSRLEYEWIIKKTSKLRKTVLSSRILKISPNLIPTPLLLIS